MSDTTSDAERARAACPAPGHRVGWVSTPWSDGLEYCACASILAAFGEVRASMDGLRRDVLVTGIRMLRLIPSDGDAPEIRAAYNDAITTAASYVEQTIAAQEMLVAGPDQPAHDHGPGCYGCAQLHEAARAEGRAAGLREALDLARDRAAYGDSVGTAIEAIRHVLRRAEAGKP